MRKPDRKKFLNAKRRLIRTLRKTIATSEQIRRDIEWWNEHRTDARPLDVGGDIVTANLARKLLDLVEAEQHIPDELWKRFNDHLKANAQT